MREGPDRSRQISKDAACYIITLVPLCGLYNYPFLHKRAEQTPYQYNSALLKFCEIMNPEESQSLKDQITKKNRKILEYLDEIKSLQVSKDKLQEDLNIIRMNCSCRRNEFIDR